MPLNCDYGLYINFTVFIYILRQCIYSTQPISQC